MKKTASSKKEVKALTADDLRKELDKARKELYLLTMKHQSNELKQPHLIKQTRREIARLEMASQAL